MLNLDLPEAVKESMKHGDQLTDEDAKRIQGEMQELANKLDFKQAAEFTDKLRERGVMLIGKMFGNPETGVPGAPLSPKESREYEETILKDRFFSEAMISKTIKNHTGEDVELPDDYVFECEYCDWETLDEDEVHYCDCGAPTCGKESCITYKSATFIPDEEESVCARCKDW